jgi:anti-anti-sigma factor
MAINLNSDVLDDPVGLQIAVSYRGTTTTIELAGEWDLAGLPAARQTVIRVLKSHPECVVLDLSPLRFIDSSGVHATTELAQRAAAQNARLAIIPGPRAVQLIFELCGLIDRLPFIEPTRCGPGG